MGAGRIHKFNLSEELNVARIPSALSELRRKRAQEHGDTNAARVCTLNLAAFCSDAASEREALGVLETVVDAHPGRMFLVTAVSEGEGHSDGLETHVAVDDEASESTATYSELIALRAFGGAVEHLPSTLVSLLEPDQPVVAWWVSTPGFGQLWQRSAQEADRLIIDTARLDAWDLMRLVEYVKGMGAERRGGLGDLNWARIRAFQAQLARFFDSPAVRERVQDLASVTICFNPPAGSATPIAGALLGAWLRLRLREMAQRQRVRFQMKMALAATRRPDLLPGDVAEVTLASGSNDLKLTVSRLPDPAHVVVGEAEVGGGGVSSQRLKADSRDKSWLLSHELQVYGRDHLYEESFLGAVEILREARRS
jgi:glucose-6-phosphate dehydrogenase assembly protein OpcA